MSAPSRLHALAYLNGVQTSYRGAGGRMVQASDESLLHVLRALGIPLSSADEADDALRAGRLQAWRQVLPPVVPVFAGEPADVTVRLPASEAGGVAAELRLEADAAVPVDWGAAARQAEGAIDLDGRRFVACRLPLPDGLPLGYHRLDLRFQSGEASALVICAPASAPAAKRAWGAFLPLHAARPAAGEPAATYTDLERLCRWTRARGGAFFGTLPLSPTFVEQPYEPSPYSAISRLAWSPFYVDLTRAPGFEHSPPARALASDPAFQAEARALSQMPLVDYRRTMALRRRVMEALSAEPANARGSLAFAASQPHAASYARFMAATERHGTWPTWSDRMRDGHLDAGGYDDRAVAYHLYAQWAAHLQAERAAESGAGLYLDFPLGTNRDGFDVWRFQRQFAVTASVGAPPDPLALQGQDWGFPPLHPRRSREHGHAYFIESVRHHMRHAAMLRIDHVMGLHRQFWVPHPLPASHGVYVRYPDRELYAILTLEAHRHAVAITGEDLGTVPGYVRATMRRRGFMPMFVAEFSLHADETAAMDPVPPGAVASLGTHDTPTFAAFLRGHDAALRGTSGQLTAEQVPGEQRGRAELRRRLVAWLRGQGLLTGAGDDAEIVAAMLKALSASDAGVVLVNLEDLWLEEEPQNVPGTGQELPNWRRKARYALDEFERLPGISDLLRQLTELTVD
ncbi:MAG: 4-alpha-glucanotransferase [SAR202 cluster bacterium]|nr:4-alpha-glucanotransferase [SAR202 cluster bacterium]